VGNDKGLRRGLLSVVPSALKGRRFHDLHLSPKAAKPMRGSSEKKSFNAEAAENAERNQGSFFLKTEISFLAQEVFLRVLRVLRG
jgi:hypothetical protein